MGLFFEFRNGSTSSWKLPRRDSLVRESLESPFRSSSVVFGEIMELHKVSVADRAELGRKMELITTFGPSSGSLFVDAPRPELYRWANLPTRLEATLQSSNCAILRLFGEGSKTARRALLLSKRVLPISTRTLRACV